MNNKIIVMTTFKRPEYTKLVLEGMRSCYGIEDYKILIHSEPGHSDVIDVIRSFTDLNIELTINPKIIGCNGNTFNCLSHGFSLSDFVIHIEDDSVPVKDCLKYFEWARDEYVNDKTVWAVTSYDQCDACNSDLYYAVYRKDWFFCFGWATWIDRWEEIKSLWHHTESGIAWDERISNHRKGRVTIVPKVPRTQNIGAENGVHVPNVEFYKKYQYNPFWAGCVDLGEPKQFFEIR